MTEYFLPPSSLSTNQQLSRDLDALAVEAQYLNKHSTGSSRALKEILNRDSSTKSLLHLSQPDERCKELQDLFIERERPMERETPVKSTLHERTVIEDKNNSTKLDAQSTDNSLKGFHSKTGHDSNFQTSFYLPDITHLVPHNPSPFHSPGLQSCSETSPLLPIHHTPCEPTVLPTKRLVLGICLLICLAFLCWKGPAPIQYYLQTALCVLLSLFQSQEPATCL